MTPSEIAALRALCDAATPGPWVIERLGGLADDYACTIEPNVIWLGQVMEGGDVDPSDAAFIAAARAAIPDLIAALEEAEAKVLKADGMANEINILTREVKAAESRADALQAEVGELAAKLTAAELDVVDYAEIRKERDEARARADAAWRAGVRDLMAAVIMWAKGSTDLARMDADRWANVLVAIAAALPPPSATPNEET